MTNSTPVQAFKLDQQGLERIFGELEAQIMEVVWRLNEPTVQDVCNALGNDQNYKTTMTVMNRLVEKKILVRRRVSRAFLYTPRESKEIFLNRVSREVAEGLLRDFGALAIAQFVDAVTDIDPDRLAELARLVRLKAQIHQQQVQIRDSGNLAPGSAEDVTAEGNQ
ncbi:MAG: BlaI/MecI/CopY family transcriptional regulator [Chloroflexi bacterium]|nr:BlaI/MecI/CopY family transcriptional regulator [Chloroflexota bacterium]